MSNVISIQSVLLNIQRRFKPKDKSWMNDAVRFVGEAIQGIGTSLPLETVSKPMLVKGRKVFFPKEMLSLLGVQYKGARIPMSIGMPVVHNTNIGNGYFINPGYLVTPFNEGEINLIFKRIPVDENGFPLIINDYDYKLAIEWYVMMNMLASGYEHKVFNYKDCDTKWEYHRGRAANSMKMPSRDEMDSIGNNWTRLFNDGDYMDSFGRGLEYSDDTIGGYSDSPDYVDRNRLSN